MIENVIIIRCDILSCISFIMDTEDRAKKSALRDKWYLGDTNDDTLCPSCWEKGYRKELDKQVKTILSRIPDDWFQQHGDDCNSCGHMVPLDIEEDWNGIDEGVILVIRPPEEGPCVCPCHK